MREQPTCQRNDEHTDDSDRDSVAHASRGLSGSDPRSEEKQPEVERRPVDSITARSVLELQIADARVHSANAQRADPTKRGSGASPVAGTRRRRTPSKAIHRTTIARLVRADDGVAATVVRNPEHRAPDDRERGVAAR